MPHLNLEGDRLADGNSLTDDCFMLPDRKQMGTSCQGRNLLARLDFPDQVFFLVVRL
jgi:hypothetical protein